MENLNLHKQKLYALILAGVTLIAMILPWMTVSLDLGGFGFGGNRRSSANGFRGWGYLSLLGIAAVVVASLMGEKTRAFDDTFKKVAMAGFGVILLGAIIFFIRINQVGGGGFQGVKSGPSFGLFIALAAGLAGLGLLLGLIKIPDTGAPKPPGATPPAA